MPQASAEFWLALDLVVDLILTSLFKDIAEGISDEQKKYKTKKKRTQIIKYNED